MNGIGPFVYYADRMKKDHKRIILRKGRVAKSAPPKKQKNDDGFRLRWGKSKEDWPDRESMRMGRIRRLTDDWGPMTRFLEKNVGREWNSVWSEICEANDERSMDGWHFRMHVLQIVDTTGRWENHCWRVTGFYVDEKGFLRYRKRNVSWRKRKKKEEDPNKRIIDDREFIRKDRTWFEVMKTVERQYRRLFDRYADKMRIVPNDVEKVRLRTLNKKELKTLGLKK